jgi:hypothetical protein
MPLYNPPAAATTTATVEPLRGNVEIYHATTGTAATAAIGNSIVSAGGTVAGGQPTTTSYRTSLGKTTYNSAATAGSTGGWRGGGTSRWRGNAAGLGGFDVTIRGGLTLLAGHQCHIGLGVTVLAGEPSTTVSGVGLAADSTDTNLQWITRDTTTATKVDTGIAKTDARVLRIRLYAAPFSSSVLAELRDDQTGTLLHTTTLTTNLPASATLMFLSFQCRNGTTTTTASLDFMRAESVGQPLI